MSNIIDLNEMSAKIEESLKQGIRGCIIRPSVAVIEVGDNPINEMIIKSKEEACNRIGIYFRHYKYEDSTPELTIVNKIKELNNDDYVNGIMIQLPLPERYNEKRLLNTIVNSKDVDGLTDINIGRLISGRKTIVPSSLLAIKEIFEENNINLSGKEALIVGKGKLVGRPLINMLLCEGATVTICHSKTEDLKKHTITADIIISATGVKNLITSDMIKDKAIVIDMGYSYDDGKICGDIEFDKISKKASLVVQKTEGINPLTTAMFLKNVLLCYNNKNKTN